MTLRIFGLSFWILPEILNDSLKPYYSFEKKSDEKMGYFYRVILLVLIAFTAH
jgi:hypothetical protein